MFEGLTFRVADGGERSRALELRRRIYEEELGHHGVDEFDERAHQLVAVDSTGELVAAFRIIGPDQRPFEIERFVDLSGFIEAKRSPAQIGGFWIRRDQRRVRNNPFLQFAMLRFAFAFAQKHALTDFVMYTYPHLRHFYQEALFQLLDLAFDHPAWGRVCVMHLDLLDLEARHARSRRPVARLLFETHLPNCLL